MKHKEWIKPLAALMMAGVMVIGNVPVSVFAEESYTEQSADAEAERIAREQEAAEEAARAATEAQERAQEEIDRAAQAAAEQAAREAAEQAQKKAQQEADQKNEPAADEDSQKDASAETDPSPESEKASEKETDVEATEETHPAITFNDVALRDGAILDISVPAGALPLGTDLAVKVIDLGESAADQARAQDILAKLSKAAGLPDGELLEASQVRAYDFFFYDDQVGETPHIQPAKGVDFTLRSLSIEGDTLDVYSIADGSSKAKCISEKPAANPGNGSASVSVKGAKEFNIIAVVGNIAAQEETEEALYPAFMVRELPVEGTDITISVEAPEGAFPEGILLSATLDETPAQVVEAANDSDKYTVDEEDIVTFDVHFYLPEDPDTEIEPLCPISITFGNLQSCAGWRQDRSLPRGR